MRLFTAAACSFLLAISALPAHALGVGDIQLESALNEPFSAEIPLKSVGNTDLTQLSVALANDETFERYNIGRPSFLSSFEFQVDADAETILITSLNPVPEPFVTLLLDIRWPSGRLLREYTVFLDPPVFEEAAAAPEVAPAETAAPAPSSEIQRQSQPEAASVAEAPAQTAVVAAPIAGSSEPAPTEVVADEPEVAAEPEPAPAPAPAPVEDRRVQQPPAMSGEYRAQNGDTLWRIANRARGDSGLTTNQTMLAIYRANPEAFMGNINALKAGSILRIPPEAEMAELGRTEANTAVKEQHAAWKNPDQSPESVSGSAGQAAAADSSAGTLELVAPGTESDSGSVQGAGGEGDAELRSRVGELEAELNEKERLLQVQDAEMQALQQRISDLESGEADPAIEGAVVAEEGTAESPFADEAVDAAEEAAVADGELADVQVEVDIDEDSPFADELDGDAAFAEDGELMVDDSEPVAEAETAPQPDEAAADPSTVVTTPAEEEPSFLGSLLGSYWLWGAAGLVLIVALFLARRRGADDIDPDATDTWQDDVDVEEHDQTIKDFSELPTFDDSIVVDEVDEELAADAAGPAEVPEPEEEPEPAPIMDEASAESLLDEDDDVEIAPTASMEQLNDLTADGGDSTDVMASDDAEMPLEKTISTGAPLNLDQADPIAEAEFHMAYGLYDQAAELLVKALETEPENRSYRVKLIEVYFVWENKEGFLTQATALHESVADDSDADWNKVLILGKQLCPESELFSGEASGGPVSDAMDLELGDADETQAIDFSLGDDDAGTEDDAVASGDDGALDFDLGDLDGDGDELSLDLGGLTDDAEAADGSDDSDGSEDNGLALDLSDAAFDEEDDDPTNTERLQDDNAATMESPTLDVPAGDAPTVSMDVADEFGGETMESPTLDIDASALNAALADDDELDLSAELSSDESSDDSDALASEGVSLDDLSADDFSTDSTQESPTLEMPQDNSETSQMPALDLDAELGGDVSDEDEEADPTSLDVDLSGLADLPLDDALDAGDDEPPVEVNIDDTLNQLDNTSELLTMADMTKTIADDEATKIARTEALQALVEEPEAAGDTVEQPQLEATDVGDTAEQPEISLEDLGDEEAADLSSVPDDATMTEVGTKLDLARAYIDMGDPDGARSILNEVLDEGGESQQQEARQLLEELQD